MKLIAVSLAAVLVALAVAVQSAEVPITTVTPTRLPVSSTPTVQTTYAKDHGHHSPTAGSSTTAAAAAAAATTASSNATTAATATHRVHSSTSTEPTTAKTSFAAATNATTPKSTITGHIALKQKLNTIAVKCKIELHAPQEIMALVSNTVVPQNEQQRCYLECVYKNLNLVKNNKFSVADGKTLAQIRFADQPEEHKKAVTIIETCEKEAIIDTKTTEKCAAGRVIRNCFVKNGEKINFFPKA
ncbi:Hypothetical protein CINCED_3A005053 [Cinara cedri]|uniref:Pheromone/general odorant binding protein n=1 Tax=Cinara cedri TaxID=506608 RepID=A0A5E4N2X8_9HEMI|nr:Hypothetical protein CINCED_3A005053 [Cinara cedri]